MVTKRVLHRTMTSSTRCFRLGMDCSSGRHSSGWREELQWRLGTAKGAWRKEMGVEPTGDRMAAPSGFEDQPPHRRRFPSSTFAINDLTATATVLIPPSAQLLSNRSGHGILPEEIKQVASTDSQARNQAYHQELSPTHPRRKPGTTDRQSIGRRPRHQPRSGQTRHASGLARA